MPTNNYPHSGVGFNLMPRLMNTTSSTRTIWLEFPVAPNFRDLFELRDFTNGNFNLGSQDSKKFYIELNGHPMRRANNFTQVALLDADLNHIGTIGIDLLVWHMRHNLHIALAHIARLVGHLPNGTTARASNVGAWYVRLCQVYGMTPYRSHAQRVRTSSGGGTRRRSELIDSDTCDVPDYITDEVTLWFNAVGVTYGHEIEVLGLSPSGAQRVLRTLPDLELMSSTNYTHQVVAEWKCVPDGTVDAEIVSPVMRGINDFLQVRRVMQTLKRGGARVGRACGGHVHFGVEHFTKYDRARFIEGHAMYEKMFDKFVRSHRRGRQRFTSPRPITEAYMYAENFVRRHGVTCNDVNGEEVTRGEVGSSGERYRHFNLQSYSRYGTFENRQLEGCLNPRKMFAWLCLNFAFFNACAQGDTEFVAGQQPILENNPQTWETQLDRVAELSHMPTSVKALITEVMNSTEAQ